MGYAKTSERREKRLLREQMRSMGLGYRTVQEVTRLAIQLSQWRDRDSVHDLRNAVLAG